MYLRISLKVAGWNIFFIFDDKKLPLPESAEAKKI
jgi:hypothetical protein